MIILLIILELILFFTNYTPHTFLAGWDNMMPELNFPVNFLRGIFGAWQEYRGLGLADGMSHAADTLHTIYIWLLSFVLPQDLLRYTFTFGMHLAGGIGMYTLLKSLKKLNPLVALIGALFYMLNFATIQMFYTPFEAFSIHFACLPWLAYAFERAITRHTKHDVALFFIVALASTPTYFVPTLLIPTALLLGVIWMISGFKRIGLAALAGFLLINAFWLTPYIANLPKNASVIANAKINQMSSNEDFMRNQAFGNAGDVLLLRGFPLDFQDYTTDGSPIYLMQSWRTFIKSPILTAIGIFFTLIALVGAITAVRSRNKTHAYVVLFVVGFIILGNNIPGIREGFAFMRQSFPTLGEALRFPFTKFSLLFAFSYSILVALGILWIFERLEKFKRSLGIIASFLIVGAILWQAAPAFTGQFISPNLRISIPSDYPAFFTYMLSRDPNERVLILPQSSYWSWKLYRFGYRGSGFIWFGIPQAIMDRAFDPWSTTNENAYWELSYALYKKDAQMISSLIKKYNIHVIVLDEHMATYGNSRSLFTYESKALLDSIPEITPEKTFGQISVYSVSNTQPAVHLTNLLTAVYPTYTWTDNDMAYQQIGDYITGNDNNAIIYPFRSLFTKRSVDEHEFKILENDKTIYISSLVEATGASIVKTTAIVYDSTRSGDLKAKSVKPCGLFTSGGISANNVLQNDGPYLRISSTSQRGCLSFDIPNLEQKNGYLVTVDGRHITGKPMMISFINDTAKHNELETYLPAGRQAFQTNTDWTTQYFILPPLAPDGLGYNPYISNDSIGTVTTVNDIRSIKIYKIPYEEMVNMKFENRDAKIETRNTYADVIVAHPNPAFYEIKLTNKNGSRVKPGMTKTLILSQSFDSGWLAVTTSTSFPYLVPAGNHVLVNNWENGWKLDNAKCQMLNAKCPTETIYIFFWPQILEFIGFLLLPIPFIIILLKKH
jgi:hypothetical protein